MWSTTFPFQKGKESERARVYRQFFPATPLGKGATETPLAGERNSWRVSSASDENQVGLGIYCEAPLSNSGPWKEKEALLIVVDLLVFKGPQNSEMRAMGLTFWVLNFNNNIRLDGKGQWEKTGWLPRLLIWLGDTGLLWCSDGQFWLENSVAA